MLDLSGESAESGQRIMIVDDEENIMMVLKRGIEKHGFRVSAFTDPLLALSNFEKDLYDLVLLDIKMPKMEGFELYQNIHKIDKEVKVCFMTAFEVYYDALKELFPDSYSSLCFIRKPFAIEEFAENRQRDSTGKNERNMRLNNPKSLFTNENDGM